MKSCPSKLLAAMLFIALTISLSGQESGGSGEILRSGINAYERGDYQQALVAFRELLVEGERPADAHFWIAKAGMALGTLTEAERSLERYLNNYPDHPDYSEARYQKARLLFMQGEYEKAISAFEGFISEYPDAPYVANAHYWAAESLFQLGHLDRARSGYRTVVQEYPRSYRVEAARYRLSVIDLTRREEELLQLLQWSHERYLSLLEDYRAETQMFEEALASYQDRLAGDAPEAAQEEIEQLRARVSQLESRLAESEREIPESTAPPAQTTADTPSATLLRLKEDALAVKEAILDQLISDAQAEGGM